MAEITAQLNRLRLAPRKVRSVANLIKGKDVAKALFQLEFLIKRPSPHLIKLIKSAISNAEHNYNMVKENLYVKDINIDEGVKLRRFKAKGFGRASRIQKKTSHIEVILAERVPGLKGTTVKQAKKETGVEHEVKEIKTEEQTRKPEIKTELGKEGSKMGNLGKRIFRRKVI